MVRSALGLPLRHHEGNQSPAVGNVKISASQDVASVHDQWTKVAKSNLHLFSPKKLLSSSMRAGISDLCSPVDLKKLAWTKLAKVNFGFLSDRKLAWTEVAKLNLGFLCAGKLAWTEVAKLILGFL